MPTPDELADRIRTWTEQGETLADEVAALDDPAPTPVPTPEPEPAPEPQPGPPAKPTGLTVTIGRDGRPNLRWDPTAGALAWEVHDVAAPAPTLRATVTEPRSVRSPLKAGQSRRYAVLAVGPGGRSSMSETVDVPPADTPEPTPAPDPTPPSGGDARFPGDITGRNWYLTLPTGTQGSPDTVKQPTLATYASEFFRLTEARDGVVFRCRHGGVTTKNSPNPRSELRETNPDGSLAWWPMRTGRHAMTVVGQVNRLTKIRPHVVLHQIHGRADDTTVWRLEGTRLWITDGDNAHSYLVTDSFALGTRYTLTTEVGDGKIRYHYNGDPVPFELITPQDDGYFKAGCYLQSNPSSAPGESTAEFAEVVVFDVNVTHAGL